jgi:hypothetical protein
MLVVSNESDNTLLTIHSNSSHHELGTSVECMKMLLIGAEVTQSVRNLADSQFRDSNDDSVTSSNHETEDEG